MRLEACVSVEASGRTIAKAGELLPALFERATPLLLLTSVILGACQGDRHEQTSEISSALREAAIKTADPHAVSITVRSGSTQRARPGTYGHLVIQSGSYSRDTVLQLSGGAFVFADIDVGDYARLECMAPCSITAANGVHTGSHSHLGPAPNHCTNPADVALLVLGGDRMAQRLSSRLREAAAEIGPRNEVGAMVSAPNGTIRIGTGSSLRADLDALRVIKGWRVALQDAGVPFAVDDDNPCTTDSCDFSTGLALHTPLPDGTMCDDGNQCTRADACQGGVCTGSTPDCTQPDAGTGDASEDSSDVSPAGDAPDACDLRTADDSSGIFVSPNGIVDANCGTRQVPCLSVQVGIAKAASVERPLVYLAPGLYTESVSLVAGVSLEGGWLVQGDSWTPDCSAQSNGTAIIRAPSDKSTTILADGLNGVARLQRVSVESKSQVDVQPGESLYGIIARGATTELTLEDVVVTVVAGGRGSDGVQGGPTSPASTAGCYLSGDGSIGTTGSTGLGGGPQLSSAGYLSSNGSPGGIGGAGKNGSPGGASSHYMFCWPVFTCAHRVGCSGFCPTLSGMDTNPGLAGCGGGGGNGGLPGAGGGSSFALYAWDARVGLIHSVLVAGDGGNGGDGGLGGSGAPGAPGAAGQPITCDDSTLIQVGSNGAGRTCRIDSVEQLPGGAAGGVGGPGGPGGQGGAGSGGWSCAQFRGGSGVVEMSATSLSHGAPGQGGAPNGSPGLAMDTCSGSTPTQDGGTGDVD